MKLYDDKLIVVTGGAGFIGSGVIRHLNDRGCTNIIVVDELDTTDKWKNLIGKQFVDIVQKKDLFDWLQGRESEIQAFLHLGACSDTTAQDANYLLENNFRYSVRLAEYALRFGHRFIAASSAATYGDGSRGFSDDHEALDLLAPLNMYGYSKHLFDLWSKRQGVLNQVVSLKYFNVFGPNEYHKGRMSSAICKMLPEIEAKGKVELFKSDNKNRFGDGEQRRDFVYVKDAVRMTCAFLENKAAGIFNIATGNASSWNELTRAVFNALGKSPKIQYIDMPEDLKGKYQDFTEADMEKTKRALGAAAETESLQTSVVDYVQNYLVDRSRW